MLKIDVTCRACLEDLDAYVDKLGPSQNHSIFITPCVHCLIEEENKNEEEAGKRISQLEAIIVKYRWFAADYEQRKIWLKRGRKMPSNCGVIEPSFDDPNAVE